MKANTKEWIQYASAIVMLASGIILTFICFFLHDDVTTNVLYYVAQAIVYSASIFGVSIYVKSTVDKAINKLKEKKEDE